MDVTTEFHDGVAFIAMDDGKKNAVTPQALADFHTALERAESEAVVLAGRAGSFCAGFGLSIMTVTQASWIDIARVDVERL